MNNFAKKILILHNLPLTREFFHNLTLGRGACAIWTGNRHKHNIFQLKRKAQSAPFNVSKIALSLSHQRLRQSFLLAPTKPKLNSVVSIDICVTDSCQTCCCWTFRCNARAHPATGEHNKISVIVFRLHCMVVYCIARHVPQQNLFISSLFSNKLRNKGKISVFTSVYCGFVDRFA